MNRNFAVVSAIAIMACGGGAPAPTPLPPGPPGMPLPPPPQPPPKMTVVYSRNVAGGQRDLFAVSEEGGPAVALANSGDDEEYLGHIGDRVIFGRYVPGPNGRQRDIYSVKVDGSGRTLLAGAATDETLIGFLDGRVIIQRDFAYPTVKAAVLSMNPDGSDMIVLGEDAGGRIEGDRVFLRLPETLEACLADGSGRTVVGPASYEILRNGNRIAALRSESHLYMANIDGSAVVDVGPVNGSRAGIGGYMSVPFVFIGDRLAFWSVDAAVSPPVYAINSVRIDGSDPKHLAVQSPGGIFIFAVFGSRIIAVRAATTFDLLSIPADGVGAVAGITNATFGGLGATRVLATRRNPGPPVTYDVLSMMPDGTGVATVATDVDTAGTGVPRVLAVAGRFVFQRNLGGQIQIESTTEDGNDLITIGVSPGNNELWGYEGSRVFYRTVSSGQGNIHAINADGSEPVTLATSADDERIAKVVSGRVFIHRLVNGQRDLEVTRVDGTATRTLASSSYDETFADAFFVTGP